jgi:hypothetical protein
MPGEGHGQALLIDHCWSIYLLLTEAFAVPSTFHVEFPTVVERALVSGLFQVTLRLTDDHTLYLREEYQLTEHHLEIRSYSYALTGPAGTPLLRADPLPHHRTHYRKRSLTAFPHHLHEGEERIRSFSGNLSEFMALAKRQVAKAD